MCIRDSSKTVSNWLGHTDPSFTLKIYVSSSPENLRASVDTVNEVMALPEGYACLLYTSRCV